MTVEFTIKNRKGQDFKCLIDDEDADLVTLNWNVLTKPNEPRVYVMRTVNKHGRHTEYIHRVVLSRILGRPLFNKEKADHKDLNSLNNTRGNIRVATHGQNKANSGVYKNNKLGVKGVHKTGNRFQAMIRVGGKMKNLGSFSTVDEAHNAYLKAAKELHGDFARGG